MIYHRLVRNKQFKYDSETGDVFRKWRHSWNLLRANKLGYIYCTLNRKPEYVHRIAWYLVHKEWALSIDHINGIRNDNRLMNLQNTNQSVNARSSHLLYRHNKTGQANIHFEINSQKYRVNINLNYIRKYIGRYKTIEEAIIARNKAWVQYGITGHISN